MKIYLDTSAFVKYYHTEKGHEIIDEVVKKAIDGKCSLVMSIWVISETTVPWINIECEMN